MKDLMIKEFKKLYDDEEITMSFFIEDKQQVYIQCKSGYAYKVTYNDGNIETECIGG